MSSTPCYNAYLSNFCWARLGPRLKCLFHLLPMDQIRLPLHIGYWLDLVFPRLALRPSVCHHNLSKFSMALLSRYRCWRARLFHGLVFRRNCSTSWPLAPSPRSLHLWLYGPCYLSKKGEIKCYWVNYTRPRGLLISVNNSLTVDCLLRRLKHRKRTLTWKLRGGDAGSLVRSWVIFFTICIWRIFDIFKLGSCRLSWLQGRSRAFSLTSERPTSLTLVILLEGFVSGMDFSHILIFVVVR